MKLREEYILESNMKFGCMYAIVGIGILAVLCLILWDPMFWIFLSITLTAVWLRKKIWG
jgi:hypothetical protein